LKAGSFEGLLEVLLVPVGVEGMDETVGPPACGVAEAEDDAEDSDEIGWFG
jgi:hypothetical protein